MEIRFLYPDLLWLLALLPLLLIGAVWASKRRARALALFAGGDENRGRFDAEIGYHRRITKALLLLVAMAGIIVAVARPQWGTRLEPIERRGVDIAIVLDRSLSMAAEDIAPSRLGHARHAVDNLLQAIEGNRVALIAFAGSPAVLCPLTLDHSAVRLFLDVVEPEATQVPGTALAEALALGEQSLRASDQDDEQRSRALVLFTDGEDHEGELEGAIRSLNNAGVSVFAVGCGTPRGAPIPLRKPGAALTASVGYKKDREGRVVTTRLDESVLEQLALETGGRYYRATPLENEIDEIATALTSMDGQEYGAVLRARFEDRYQIPLALALLALLIETLLGDRKRRTTETEASS